MRALALGLAVAMAACGGGDTFFVDSEHARMPVWVRGAAASQPLVLFIHGGPGGVSTYFEEEPAMQTLQQTVAVAYWDQRGAGSSWGQADPTTYTLKQSVKDLDVVVQALAQRYPARKLVLMGWSWGGAVSGEYLSDPVRAARISGWVNVDGTVNAFDINATSRAWAMERAQTRVNEGREVEKWSKALTWYEATPVLGPSSIFRHDGYLFDLGGVLTEPKNQRGLGSLHLNLFTPFSGLTMLSNVGANAAAIVSDGPENVLKTDLSRSMESVTVPTLFIWGREDGAVPVSTGERAFTRVAATTKRMVVIEGAAHEVFADRPAEFTAEVLPFLDAL